MTVIQSIISVLVVFCIDSSIIRISILSSLPEAVFETSQLLGQTLAAMARGDPDSQAWWPKLRGSRRYQ